ncbi:hypothetical protein [Anaerolinea sp.]|uniref:hypothetical protein n=1 Tax=Anaerolinea sp. TaxID=1872519 RepID=UPI002ACD822D|nr:hypothetical protein [Anaerolinea sp.]
MQTLLSMLRRRRWVWMLVNLALIALLTAVVPPEKTLGERIRLVYFHGAWVWTGKIAFALAGLGGLAALIFLLACSRLYPRWAEISLALGRTGLFFWLTYLPVSLLVQQINWGGIFWDEPRWRIPATFGVVAVLVQVAISLFDLPWLTALVNTVFGAALWLALGGAENVLHPDSPIFSSNSVPIEGFFVALLGLSLLFMAQFALWMHDRRRPA